jgi:D-alanyl-D-alanine carboxypeptidase
VALAAATASLVLAQVSFAGPAIVTEPASGRVLFAEEPDRPWYPASLTKMMTAYVVFEALDRDGVDPETEIVISQRANAQPRSRMGLGAGKTLTVEDALAGLMTKSANDLAVALAEAVSGSEEAFVSEMNATAFRLGMLNTRFVNPHGLPGEGQATTARDMALLAQALLRDHPTWDYLYSQRLAEVGPRTVGSHNDVLHRFEGADGIKTGFTCGAGYNVVASATREGRRIVAVVLGERSNLSRTVRAEQLLTFGFATSPTPQADEPVQERPAVSGEALVDVGLVTLPTHASEMMQVRNCWPPGQAPKPTPTLIATAPEPAADGENESNSGAEAALSPPVAAADTGPAVATAPSDAPPGAATVAATAPGAATSTAATAAVAAGVAAATTDALPVRKPASGVGPARAGAGRVTRAVAKAGEHVRPRRPRARTAIDDDEADPPSTTTSRPARPTAVKIVERRATGRTASRTRPRAKAAADDGED